MRSDVTLITTAFTRKIVQLEQHQNQLQINHEAERILLVDRHTKDVDNIV